ncbi:MAG: hypothetical protein IJX47_05455 [Clostridia bacterium]|nr:hypothetical protein [Clostridia bacterium]
MRKKLTALLLAAAMCTGSALLLASCAEGESGAKSTQDPATTTPSDPSSEISLDQLPTVDMEGAVIAFAIAETDAHAGDTFHQRSIVPPDEESEDTVDMAVFTRNAKIETKYNCTIEIVNYMENNLSSTIGSQLIAGTSDYDILGARQYDDVQLALDGVVYDLNMLTTDFPEAEGYLNLDASYWAKGYNDALQIGNGRYWVTGDLCLRYSGGYYCYFVNHTKYNEYLGQTYGNIYDIVRSGEWTLDTLTQMTEGIWDDLDGSDTTSTDDMLAIAQPVWDNANGLSISSGVQYSYRHEDGTIQLTMVKGNKQLENFMTKFYNLLQKDGVYNYGGEYNNAMKKLVANEAVFASGRLNQAELYLQEMEDNYGILPNPKLSSDQTNYVSSIHDGVQLYGINNNSEQIPYAALILDALELESRKSVRPMYFDSAVKIVYSRGSDDAEMIDLMDASIYSDFVYVWQFSAEMNGMGDWLRNAVKSKNGYNNINRVQGTWEKGLEDILEEIEQLEAASAV